MSRFRDHTGQEWEIRLTVGAVSAVKRETGTNLALVSQDTSWVETIFGEVEGLVKILWTLCERQAKSLGIDPDEFAFRFDGPTLEAAGIALANAIADFFPRSAVAKAIKSGLTTLLEKADAKAVAEIERLLSMDLSSPTSAPASSASIPAS